MIFDYVHMRPDFKKLTNWFGQIVKKFFYQYPTASFVLNPSDRALHMPDDICIFISGVLDRKGKH